MALCIRDMPKAAGAYAKFENPDQFRAVNRENGTRPNLIFVVIQEQQILGDVLITEPYCRILIRQQANIQGWASKRGEVSKGVKYFYLSFSRRVVFGAVASKVSSERR